MNEPHHHALERSLKDMIQFESELSREFSTQLADEEVQRHSALNELLTRGVRESEARIADLKVLLDSEGRGFGAAVKSGLVTVTGTLAGLFGRGKEPSLPPLVRDDLVALNYVSIGYAMMLTLALATNHHESTLLAGRAIEELPPVIVPLTDLLPLLVGEDLARTAPLASPTAVQIAGEMIRDAWRNT